MAQDQAKKYGINFNYEKVINSINRKHGAQAKQALNKAADNAEKQFNQLQNQVQSNPNVQKFQNQTPNKVITKIQTELKKQLNKVNHAQAKKSLTNLLNQGAQEAKDQLKSQGLLNKNIKNQVDAKLPELEQNGQQELKKLQQKVNQQIRNL